jgi:hypothetical protein
MGPEIERLRAEIVRLKAIIIEMLNAHGRRRREEWESETAYEHAKAVNARARRVAAKDRKEK